ncbi:hypothetical protein BDDG_11975 [Blastomyces dermatitidis ATCC 18188]|uniref:Uncharacterized protein n=1 Tax=Ajellomyces dermatitidis (strain ATCC 18188 / CBS 674.68) TaxID=653446 RepID=A0A0J9HDT3_AJEDA|nr:hypothetical protein BDDG_11975 [Blastomyces dermatitidis ATCC 18188]
MNVRERTNKFWNHIESVHREELKAYSSGQHSSMTAKLEIWRGHDENVPQRGAGTNRDNRRMPPGTMAEASTQRHLPRLRQG